MFSFSASSLRAIPVLRLINRVYMDPYTPEVWGSNQKGMQPGEELPDDQANEAYQWWNDTRDAVLHNCDRLAELKVHKELVNRLLQPFSWVSMVITATDWDNFFSLRCHPDAQYEIRKLAGMMRDSLSLSSPRRLLHGDWHLPFTTGREQEDLDLWTLKRLSAARCARVSYNTHDNKKDLAEDLRLANDLLTHVPAHLSPLEHQAVPDTEYEDKLRHLEKHTWLPRESLLYNANFRGWKSYRRELECGNK